MRDLLVPCQQLGARRTHLFARLVEPERGLLHLLLKNVEALPHLAEFVMGQNFHRRDVHRHMRGIKVAATERRHGVREVPQHSRGQPLRRVADVGRRVRDHSRKDDADGDRQQGDDHEYVFQRGRESLMSGRHAADRHEVAGAVEHQHEQHRAGQLGVQRVRDDRQALAQPVFDHAPSVERGARIGERETEQNRWQAELLEAENGRQQPNSRGRHAEHDRAAWGAVGPNGVRQIAAQQPSRQVGHADADEVGEIRRRDQPDRITHDQEDDRHAGGQ
jgi:hypothetical protein